MLNNDIKKREKVLKYLNKNLNEVKQDQSLVNNQIMVHETKIKELYKAISIAEKEIDPNYSLFSPKTTGKLKMNDTLLKEVHILENELEELKYKNIRLLEKIDTTKDIICCIIGETDEESMCDNSLFLDELIKEREEKKSNDNYNSDNDLIENGDGADNSEDFEMLTDEIEETEEYIFNDEIRKKFLNIQEAEKNRIARDLHDTTVQNLTSLIHKSELCLKLVDIDQIRTKLELQTMINTLKESVDELRYIIYGLKPMSLDDLGLSVTVKRFVDQLNLTDGPRFNLSIEGFESKEIESVVTLTLFRIIQEASNNAIKHSKAKNVDILIDFLDDCINVIIMDDGKGFDHTFSISNDSNSLNGFGISIMKERTYLLSGRIMIDYVNEEEKTGTKIVVIIPINKN